MPFITSYLMNKGICRRVLVIRSSARFKEVGKGEESDGGIKKNQRGEFLELTSRMDN